MSGVTTIDPATGAVLGRYPYTSDSRLDAALDAAVTAGACWGGSSVTRRQASLRALADKLTARRAEYAALITAEMGKPIDQALAEIAKCARTCAFYAERLPELLAPERIDLAPDSGVVRLRPLGTLLAIMPWNYPFWQVIRSMVPAVAAGNTVLLKHADNVTGSAERLTGLFDDVFGKGVLGSVVLPPERTGALIDDSRVAAVAFTGSNRVGALVAARAGAAVKKTVLELGGSDPFVVLPDADVPAAARAAVRSRFLNVGQSCIAAKRLIVHRAVYGEFAEAVVAGIGELVVGDPRESGVDIGPMARTDLRDTLRGQLDAALRAGARLLTGGAPDSRPGAWFRPTAIEVSGVDGPAFQEETFGPLAVLFPAESEEDAVRAANATRYGLSCAVWSGDPDRALAVAERIGTGSIFVNRVSESDARLPVGGVKASGHGRELGRAGITEFANLQAVRTAFPARKENS
ncbi:aldehyde dehydrogenase family protein [Amycolatopsis sp. NPDC058986]|uniref:aldehyde dehydrogenase family protein n=1 Tax=unclassified Amycolatopsis TaxID=2618356 RepID=UPI003670C2B9